MFKAINSATGKEIWVQEFEKLGKKTTLGLVPAPALCRYCRSELDVRGGMKERHFYHRRGHFPCPTIVEFAQPYLPLTPSCPDLERAAELREAFKDNWRLHYRELNRLVPWLSFKEFLQLLDEADSKKIFAYTELKEEDIPYLLVLARDFVPETSAMKKRKNWYRFWYEGPIRRVHDLWIVPPERVQLVRGEFKPPEGRAKYPDIDKDFKRVILHRTPFLEAEDPKLPDFVIEGVNNWFKTHSSF